VIRRSLVLAASAAALALFLVSSLASVPAGAGRADLAGGPGAAPPLARPGVIPAGPKVRMSPAEASRAADRCASWASKAGFANSGPRGHLVVAVAIALAESGCDPRACLNDTTHRECTPQGTRHSRDSIDRGAWQINSRYWPGVSNDCAYHGLCSARVAYRSISANGTYFRAWETYIKGIYKRYPRDHHGAKVRLARCGSASNDQMWTRSHAKLRTRRGLCLAARNHRSGPVILERCSGRWRQQWWGRTSFSLYNRGAHRCLTDPGGKRRIGYPLSVGHCFRSRSKSWFRP
jgi:Lysozyme like domain/Ricin-type beta-trefoil lectin domain